MSPHTVEQHIRRSAVYWERASRFLTHVTWIAVVVLAVMAAALLVQPVARLSGLLSVARVASFVLLGGFMILMVLVGVLRRRLAVELDRMCTQIDIVTEQNERLELLNRRLSEAQAVARLAYWEIDGQTHHVYWSEEMYRLFGVEPDTRPPSIDEFLHAVHAEDRERVRDIATRAVRDLAEFAEQYRLVDAAGNVSVMQASGRVLDDGRGGRKLVGTVQDVSSRVDLEAQLRQAQKMEAMGRLAGGIAHDFNNVLTVIQGYVGLLLSEGPQAFRAHLEEIQSAARRAGALVRQLLAFSRQQVLQPRVLDVNEVITGFQPMIERIVGEDVGVTVKLAPDLHTVRADVGQLEQVLMNLVVNARDAMPDGGALTITTTNVELDEVYAERHRLKRGGAHIMIAVADTGVGIAPEILDRVFDPFFTTKPMGVGTGLGLSTAYGIVEQSDGHMRVESVPHHGTTFRVYLPKADRAHDRRRLAASSSAA
jgi:PAS domain S-box-containing protein